jgi:hypothetical protein
MKPGWAFSIAVFAAGALSAVFGIAAAGESDFTHAANRASLDQLAAVQTFVRAAMTGGKFCAPEERGVSAPMMQLLEGEVRLKLDRKKDGPGRVGEVPRSLFADGRRLRECESRCRCGIYLAWLERAEVPEWTKDLRARAENLDERKIVRCAEANRKWICSSVLWRGLVDEARAAVESGN